MKTMLWMFVILILIPVVALVILKRKQKQQKQVEAAAAAEKQRKLDELRTAREAEHAERKARAAEWAAQHGRLVLPLAGVTFDNEDGRSRQKILRELKANDGVCDLELEPFTWKGSDAVRVIVDGEVAGNIRKSDVPKVMEIFDRIENAHVDVETFTNDDDERIYRADLTIIYAK